MKKSLHFFGCSFTVGDELPDEALSNILSLEEYYEHRKSHFADYETELHYVKKCKSMSYPALIEDEKYATFNHAELGASLRANIFYILKLIANPGNRVDIIFLQPPSQGRELYLLRKNDSIKVTSLQLSNPMSQLKEYAEHKLKSHNVMEESALNDLMDLAMLNSILKEKNIKFYLIDFFKELELRKKDITGFNTSFDFFNSMLPEDIIVCQDIGGDDNNKLASLHFNKLAHRQIADRIKQRINYD